MRRNRSGCWEDGAFGSTSSFVPQHKSPFSFLHSHLHSLCPPLSLVCPKFFPLLFPLTFPPWSLPLPLAANPCCHSQQGSCPWPGESSSLLSDSPGTRQRLWSLGSSIDRTTKAWWKEVSSKKFTLRPVVKENADIVTTASFFPLCSLSKTCPLQRDGMRFRTIWECSVTQYYLRFSPCFMLLSDPWVLPSSQWSVTLRWLPNSPLSFQSMGGQWLVLFCILPPCHSAVYLCWYPGTRHRNQSRLSCLRGILNAFCSKRRFVFISQLRTQTREASIGTQPGWEGDAWAVGYSQAKAPQLCSPFGPTSWKGSPMVPTKACRHDCLLEELMRAPHIHFWY